MRRNASKNPAKSQRDSFVSTRTGSNKRKLQLQQEVEIKHESESPVSEHGYKSFDRVCTRRMAKQITTQLHEVKPEPGKDYSDEPVKKNIDKKTK